MRGKTAWTAGVIFLFLTSGAFAGPQTLSYQGYLTGPDSRPVVDATYPMRFTLYDGSSGGVARWTETETAVPVASGL